MQSVAGAGVVVTGGGSGIGAALARRFAAEGARVVVNDLNGAAAAEVARSCGATAAPGDAASEDGVAALVATARDVLGEIDLYCANAGVARRGRHRGELGSQLAGQRDGARPRRAAAAAALAGARQRPPDLHGVRGGAAHHARLCPLFGHQARRARLRRMAGRQLHAPRHHRAGAVPDGRADGHAGRYLTGRGDHPGRDGDHRRGGRRTPSSPGSRRAASSSCRTPTWPGCTRTAPPTPTAGSAA